MFIPDRYQCTVIEVMLRAHEGTLISTWCDRRIVFKIQQQQWQFGIALARNMRIYNV